MREFYNSSNTYVREIIAYQIENYIQAISDLEYFLNNDVFKNAYSQNLPNAYEKLGISYAKVGLLNK